MEEDAGKSIHDVAIAGSDATHVDLNRAGVPLLEIVSEPDLRSPAEAAAYLRTLRSILRYVEVSDADMEKGHFRCDANVSLRRHGETRLGTRTELKNLNSFRFVELALDAEIERQAELLEQGHVAAGLIEHRVDERRLARGRTGEQVGVSRRRLVEELAEDEIHGHCAIASLSQAASLAVSRRMASAAISNERSRASWS